MCNLGMCYRLIFLRHTDWPLYKWITQSVMTHFIILSIWRRLLKAELSVLCVRVELVKLYNAPESCKFSIWCDCFNPYKRPADSLMCWRRHIWNTQRCQMVWDVYLKVNFTKEKKACKVVNEVISQVYKWTRVLDFILICCRCYLLISCHKGSGREFTDSRQHVYSL